MAREFAHDGLSRKYKRVHDATMKAPYDTLPMQGYERVTNSYPSELAQFNHTIRRDTQRTLVVYAQYPSEDAIPVGVLFCRESVCTYADVMTSGKLANHREVPLRYGKRFPEKAMRVLCGCTGARVYAKRV